MKLKRYVSTLLCACFLVVFLPVPTKAESTARESTQSLPVELMNGVCMVPLRSAFESLGITVVWLQEESAIELTDEIFRVYILLQPEIENHFIAMRDTLKHPPYGSGNPIHMITQGYYWAIEGSTYLSPEAMVDILSALGFSSQPWYDGTLQVQPRGVVPQKADLFVATPIADAALQDQRGDITISFRGLVSAIGGEISTLDADKISFSHNGQLYMGTIQNQAEKSTISIQKLNTDDSNSLDSFIQLNPTAASGTGIWYENMFYLSLSPSELFLNYFGYQIVYTDKNNGTVYIVADQA